MWNDENKNGTKYIKEKTIGAIFKVSIRQIPKIWLVLFYKTYRPYEKQNQNHNAMNNIMSFNFF